MQASVARRRQGSMPNGRDLARGNAHEPDGGTPDARLGSCSGTRPARLFPMCKNQPRRTALDTGAGLLIPLPRLYP
ncbi:MAG: hypothetical protein EPO43_06495 [Rugosibacter sp.]|nr:MAG: hypothetical protein EPO43_06495 [Rugosibacter sp.]